MRWSAARRAFIVAPALAAVVAAAAPPSDNPSVPYGKKIQNGRTVGVQLQDSSIVLTGTGLGAKSDGYRVKRPCWYEPGKSAEDMLKSQEDIRAFWFHVTPNSSEAGFQEFLKQFKDKIGQEGRWWTPAYNAADPDGMACWTDLVGALWVPPRTTPPGGVTQRELSDIARAALTVPEPKVKLSPDAKSYVNLPTWVWLPGNIPTTRSVTATIPGVMSATVTATLGSIKIDAGTTADRAEVKDQCGPSGRAYVKGADFTCGVRYLRASTDQPRKSYVLTVTTVWPVTSTVPFNFTPVQASATRDVPVGEVQSTVRDSTP